MSAPATIPEFWPGLCECGCGEPTRLASRNDPRYGWRKGEPLRFVRGHNERGKTRDPEMRRRIAASQRGKRGNNWKGADAGYSAIHSALRRDHPRALVCDECGVAGIVTEYAFLYHPAPHTRDIGDYRELCRPCHKSFDAPSKREARLVAEIERLRTEIEKARRI